MGETRWLDAREARAWRTLQMMQMRLDGELARLLAAESGLSYQDYTVLGRTHRPTRGPDAGIRAGRPARLGEEPALASRRGGWPSAGLVKKEKCASDRRGSFVSVTAAGRKEIEDAAPGHVTAVRRLFIDRLTPDQIDALADVAETVLAAFDTSPGDES